MEIKENVSGAYPQVAGLPVKGCKATQSPEAIAAVDVFKELEERTLRHIDWLNSQAKDDGTGVSVDPRLLAVGRTQLQGAFMFLARAIFQPQRVALPGDDMLVSGEEVSIPEQRV